MVENKVKDYQCAGGNKIYYPLQMKIVLWLGNEANQKALANKIHALFPLAGIVTETRKHQPKINGSKLFEKVFEKLFLASIGRSWMGMKAFYEKKFPEYPKVNSIDVENINSDDTFNFTKSINPDLIFVSGTRLIKDKLLSLKPGAIMNLHTGLSPYIKGGPNCTNWCIATKQFHLIGNTVMFIDAGIDSGNIITTEQTSFTGEENLLDVHIKVMEHAHQLSLKAIEQFSNGKVKGVKQSDISEGKTYYTKQWGLKEKIKLASNMVNFCTFFKSADAGKLKATVMTIKI